MEGAVCKAWSEDEPPEEVTGSEDKERGVEHQAASGRYQACKDCVSVEVYRRTGVWGWMGQQVGLSAWGKVEGVTMDRKIHGK